MSYRIEYDMGAEKYEIRRERPVLPLILPIMAAGVLFLCCFWPGAFDHLRSYLIPGKDANTIQAFSVMADELRSGARLMDAVEGFCRMVINGP